MKKVKSGTKLKETNENNNKNRGKKEKTTKEKIDRSNYIINQKETDENMAKDESRLRTYKKERFVKNEFRVRCSLLDESSPDSYLNQSIFKGMVHMGKLIGIIIIIIIPLIRSLETGSFFKIEIFNSFKRDFFMVISSWPFFYCWSYMAFFIQKLVILQYPRWLILLLQHSCQSFIFLFTVSVVYLRGWGVTHTVFIITQTCVHFMKMHSYTIENRILRENWLKDQKVGKVHNGPYPHNINLKNFNYFLLVPTLSYEAEYPKSGPFRPGYAFHKMMCAIGSLTLLYIIASEFMLPIWQDIKVSFLESLIKLILFMIWWFIIFFMFLFEYYMNFFGEITRFGDRQFYQDWWNSSSWDEWARKWNRPVHEFLFRNVYLEAINFYKLSPTVAQFIAFVFSACLHELILALIFRTIRPFLFVFMLLQIPLIYSGRKLKYKGTNFGNMFVLWGLTFGMPLITMIYLRDEEVKKILFA